MNDSQQKLDVAHGDNSALRSSGRSEGATTAAKVWLVFMDMGTDMGCIHRGIFSTRESADECAARRPGYEVEEYALDVDEL